MKEADKDYSIVPYDDFKELRIYHNCTFTAYDEEGDPQLVLRTITGPKLMTVVDKVNDPDSYTDYQATLEYLVNRGIDGDIRDLSSATDFAKAADPCVFLPEADKVYRVVAFHGLVDTNLSIPANNKLHVVLLKSPDGYTPLPAWDAQNPIKPSVENGWTSLNDPVREAGQEYTRWFKNDFTAYAVDFAYESIYRLGIKANQVPFKVNGKEVLNIVVPYKQRGAALHLDGSLNERVEMWNEAGAVYTDSIGNPIEVLQMAILFDRVQL